MSLSNLPIDTIQPWTIKAVSVEIRRIIVRSAEIEGLTVGQWLERRVREWVVDGSRTALQTRSAPSRPVAPDYSPLEELRALVAIDPSLLEDNVLQRRLKARARVVSRQLGSMTRSQTRLLLDMAPAEAAPLP